MTNNNWKLIKADTAFVSEILDKIIEKEIERGNDTVSYRTATKILAKRIGAAGGLRE